MQIVAERADGAERGGPAPLRVLIYAALVPGESGGIEQSTSSLIAGLGQLSDGNEQYLAVTDEKAPDWLDPVLGPNTSVVVREGPRRRPVRPVDVFTRGPRKAFRTARGAYRRLAVPSHRRYDLFVERLTPDVVHFPYQWFQHTSAPSLFNPWDLQHVHFPQFFDAETIRQRQSGYALACAHASLVEVASAGTRDDLMTYLHVPASKISVVPRSAPTLSLPFPDPAALSATRRAYGLPERFAFYPAHTWPHKNHRRLMEAVAMLRDRGCRVDVVLAGRRTDFWPQVARLIDDLGIADRVRHLGFVPREHIRPLYRLATCTVFPTLFEGYGFPAVEALAEASPLLCSDLPVLRGHSGDAAEYFDPYSVEDVARALAVVIRDERFREQLQCRGAALVHAASPEAAARTFRALYRKLAGVELSYEDRRLIETAGRAQGPRIADG